MGIQVDEKLEVILQVGNFSEILALKLQVDNVLPEVT